MAGKHFIELMREEAQDISNAFFGLGDAIEKQGGLDAKTFNLIYLAIKATVADAGAVAAHAGMAKTAGATREEVRGAVLVTLMTNGIHGVSSCLAAALDAYDNA